MNDSLKLKLNMDDLFFGIFGREILVLFAGSCECWANGAWFSEIKALLMPSSGRAVNCVVATSGPRATGAH